MATIYVDNNGSNTSPYDTWAKAATTLNTALNAWSTGDIILVDKAHTEGTATITFPAVGSAAEPVPVYTADPADDSYAVSTADTLNASDVSAEIVMPNSCHVSIYGITFNAEGNIKMQAAAVIRLVDCTFKTGSVSSTITLGSANPGYAQYAINCTFSTTAGTYHFTTSSDTHWDGCTFDGSLGAAGMFRAIGVRAGKTSFVGCDFSGLTVNAKPLVDLSKNPTGQQKSVFTNCSLPVSIDISDNGSGSDDQYAEVISTDGAGNLYRYELHHFRGTITTQTGDLYRTSGYSDADGNTNASHKIVPTSSLSRASCIQGPMLTQYISSTGSTTLTVHAADTFTTAPNKNQLYIEVFHLGNAGETLWSYGTSRDADILATTALTTTTGEWTDSGSALNNEYKMEKTITINQAGYIGVRVVLEGDQTAETANAVYYDPKIEIS